MPQKIIAQAKLAHVNNFVGDLDDQGNVYKEIKKINLSPPISTGGWGVGDRVFQTNQATADVFA